MKETLEINRNLRCIICTGYLYISSQFVNWTIDSEFLVNLQNWNKIVWVGIFEFATREEKNLIIIERKHLTFYGLSLWEKTQNNCKTLTISTIMKETLEIFCRFFFFFLLLLGKYNVLTLIKLNLNLRCPICTGYLCISLQFVNWTIDVVLFVNSQVEI